MKKFLIILGIIFAIIILSLVAIPILFKGKIQEAVDLIIEEKVDAKVYYDTDQFNISLIKNFPNLSITIGNFGVVGKEPFEGDTLAHVESFQLSLNVKSLIKRDPIVINKVLLKKPLINIKVLKDGKANYDIAKPSDVPEEQKKETSDSSSTNFNIALKKWAIEDARFNYDDQSMKFFTKIKKLNHEGTGDFTVSIFDLMTNTKAEGLSLGYGNVEYISNKNLNADITLNMDLDNMKFIFKENKISLNDFGITADGFLEMPEDGMNMDIQFGGKNNSIKSILSLIPGTYKNYLDGVTASGVVNFDGYIKGMMKGNQMPKIAAKLNVDNGNIRYSEYDIPMENLTIRSNFNYPSADLKQTSFNVDHFSMLVDGEELNAKLKFKNLEDYNWDLAVNGNADLEKITKIVPVEGMKLAGKLNIDLTTSGKMSDVTAERYDLLPTSGKLNARNFSYQGEAFPLGAQVSEAQLIFDPSQVNLTKLNGRAGSSDFSLNGKLTNYMGFVMDKKEVLKGNLNLNSSLVNLDELMPKSEESSETKTETAPTETPTNNEVVRIPKNIEFTLASTLNTIKYTTYTVNNFNGRIRVENGEVLLQNNNFEMLGGSFNVSGAYDTKEELPAYNLDFGVNKLAFQNVYNAFATVKKYAPIVEKVEGLFSSRFKMNGVLNKDMSPILDKISANGLIDIDNAGLEKGDFLSSLSSVASFFGTNNNVANAKSISLQDTRINAEIKDGRLHTQPFDLNVGGYSATVSGSNGINGDLDYKLLVKDVPTGAIGNILNNAISSLLGGTKLVSDKINLKFGIRGDVKKPKIKLIGTEDSSSGSSTSQGLVSQVNERKKQLEEELARQKEEAEQKARELAEKAKQEAERKARELEEQARKRLEEEKKKLEEKAKKKVNGVLKDLFGGGGN